MRARPGVLCLPCGDDLESSHAYSRAGHPKGILQRRLSILLLASRDYEGSRPLSLSLSQNSKRNLLENRFTVRWKRAGKGVRFKKLSTDEWRAQLVAADTTEARAPAGPATYGPRLFFSSLPISNRSWNVSLPEIVCLGGSFVALAECVRTSDCVVFDATWNRERPRRRIWGNPALR